MLKGSIREKRREIVEDNDLKKKRRSNQCRCCCFYFYRHGPKKWGLENGNRTGGIGAAGAWIEKRYNYGAEIYICFLLTYK